MLSQASWHFYWLPYVKSKKQGIQGKINWEEGLRTRVAALKGLDEKVCQEVANNLPIMTGAKEACRILKAAGWKIMAVSGGFTLMMDRLQKELGLDYVFCNLGSRNYNICFSFKIIFKQMQ